MAAAGTAAAPTLARISRADTVANTVEPAAVAASAISAPVVKESKADRVVAAPAGADLTEAARTASAGVAVSSPAFVLSAGLEPSQTWMSRNKCIFGAIVVIAATVAGILLLR
jgi:hypothetical protein